ncbi:hypothetical protein ACQY0O_000567 [Thecaphora frezii]
MSFNIPNVVDQDGYLDLPAEYRAALDKALAQFEAENDPATDAEWEDAGEREGVKLYRKTSPQHASDVPTVKGVTVVENTTPMQVFSIVQIPGMRKKWDPRFESGESLERYSPHSFLFYSVTKSPSYFVWARDLVGVQENLFRQGGDEIIIVQTSVSADKYVSEAASYSKSRTRATLEVSAWKISKEGANDTKVEYVVKIHLNGSLPTSVVSMVATETPMCVGRVRDIAYTYGHAPHEVLAQGEERNKTSLVHAEYEDGDGTEATGGAKRWTGYYFGEGTDTFAVKYDNQRLYSQGIKLTVSGAAASKVQATDDAAAGQVKVEVDETAKGEKFTLVIEPQ